MPLSTVAPSTEQVPDSIPFSLPLELTVTDAEVIAELWTRTEGRERDDFALAALRLGVLALRQARGQVDANAIRREGDRLFEKVQFALSEHRSRLDDSLVGTLKDYFDPGSGRFTERVQSLLKKDGELETLLARKITAEDSEMSRTLSAHVGKDSPLFRMLSPTDSEGLLKALREAVNAELVSQRNHLLREFSLDNQEGALFRIVLTLTDNNGQLKNDLQGKIDNMLKQFSFDDEQSALSRMKNTIDTTRDVISKHLTLDDESSALSRLRRELMDLLKGYGESSQKFQVDVRSALEGMKARREESTASTRHGIDFESQVLGIVQDEAQRLRDVATPVGNSTGEIKNCKKGDCLIELGPETPAPGARIVVEAKEVASFGLRDALIEIGQARKNRRAEVGVFVFSKRTAPIGLESIARYGEDVVVLWDSDDAATDLFLRLGISVARALCVRKAVERSSLEIDFTHIDQALLEIKKQVEALDEIRSWADTITSNSNKILDRVRISRQKLDREATTLAEWINNIKGVLVKKGELTSLDA